MSDTPPQYSAEERQWMYEAARLRRAAARDALAKRLEEEGADDLASKLRKCGEPIPLTCIGCGDVRDALTRCDRKWCPACAPKLATMTTLKYQKLVEEMVWPLFVTFTVENYADPDVRPLRRAWGKLRRLRWFRRCARGGVAAFECTAKNEGYHWHVHALIDCHWLSVTALPPHPQASKAEWIKRGKIAAKEVGEQWELCTGRRASVHVRRVWKKDGGDVTKACLEVLKYAVTAETLLSMTQPVAPMLRMLQGTRLVTSFGTCFGKAPKAEKRPPPMCKCGCADRIPSFLVPDTTKRFAYAPIPARKRKYD